MHLSFTWREWFRAFQPRGFLWIQGFTIIWALFSTSLSAEVLPPVVLAAGDIADCGPGAAQTASILDREAGLILALGDLAYPDGSKSAFKRCYAPTWGRFSTRLQAVPGNHEYMSPGARPYFTLMDNRFDTAADGYSEFRYHGWQIIGLNSHLSPARMAQQHTWLKNVLKGSSARCRLAFVHLPRFSSGEGGDNLEVDALWRALAEAKTSVLLAGHDHLYERFAPMNAEGGVSPQGIRSFVVGTGGAALDDKPWWGRRHSEKIVVKQWGVLKLELLPEGYRWQFLAADGAVLDAGSSPCVR